MGRIIIVCIVLVVIRHQTLHTELNAQEQKRNARLDCKLKKLAFDYAKKLSPGTGTDFELELIFKGLELGAVCNESFHGQNFYYPWSEVDEIINPDETAIIFVDQSRGKNIFEGSIVKPLFDIQSGIDHCSSKIQGSKFVRNCIVNIRQGIYQLDKPLKLYSNIELTNYKDEKVVVSGFKTITPKWKKFVERTDLFENLNPIFEKINPKESSNKIRYFGITSSSKLCKTECGKLTNCSSFVYFDASDKNFGSQCYGRFDSLWNPVKRNTAKSGKKVNVLLAAN